ncbi:hypothetical protein NL676_001579 [Syzygium grande]|nr:hypothetical protein NL676_001579 [Syzygium grande]
MLCRSYRTGQGAIRQQLEQTTRRQKPCMFGAVGIRAKFPRFLKRNCYVDLTSCASKDHIMRNVDLKCAASGKESKVKGDVGNAAHDVVSINYRHGEAEALDDDIEEVSQVLSIK